MANDLARRLRKRMTPQEVKLWQSLRSLRALGHHFRRQSPLAGYIVDFEHRRARLVIEVDGGQHCESVSDRSRDKVLADAGYAVMRFWNSDIDESVEGVVDTILARLEQHGR